jgi:hypothetical protein
VVEAVRLCWQTFSDHFKGIKYTLTTALCNSVHLRALSIANLHLLTFPYPCVDCSAMVDSFVGNLRLKFLMLPWNIPSFVNDKNMLALVSLIESNPSLCLNSSSETSFRNVRIDESLRGQLVRRQKQLTCRYGFTTPKDECVLTTAGAVPFVRQLKVAFGTEKDEALPAADWLVDALNRFPNFWELIVVGLCPLGV